jgi:hypothetical protein
MPQLADITVKKADGTTNIVWTGVAPASGTDPAVWRSMTVGTSPGHKPELRLSARDGGSRNDSRVMRGTLKYPQIATNSTTGVTSVINSCAATVDVTMPKGMAQTDIDEFVAQTFNLLASALLQACLKAGYSAT